MVRAARNDDLSQLVWKPPWRTQAFALGAFFAIAFLLRFPSFFRSVLDWDESLYLLMASAWVSGHLPYTSIWDNKPLGIYAIFAASLVIFGHHIAAIRAATIIAATLTAFAVFRIAGAVLPGSSPCSSPGSSPRTSCAWAAGIAYSIGALSNDGLAANTEMFMVCFTALSLATAFSQGAPARIGVVTGMLFAAAILTKYVAVFEAPAVLLALLWWQPRGAAWRRFGGAIIGGIIPLAAIILLYAAHGQLGLWYQDSIAANLLRAGAVTSPAALLYALQTQLGRWLPFYLAPLIMLWQMRRPGPERRSGIFLFVWLVCGAIGVASAKSFYDHYFQQILPVLSIIMGMILSRLRWHSIAAVFAVFIAIPVFAAGNAIGQITQPLFASSGHTDTPTRIAAGLRMVLQPGQNVYVFDDQPVIYFLLNQAPPTRFVLPSTLTTNFLGHVAGVNAREEVSRILALRPAYIIISNFPAAGAPNKNQPVYDIVNATLAAFYHPWRVYDTSTIYEVNN